MKLISRELYDGAANSIDALNNQYFFLISSYLHKEAQGDLNASNHENWTPLHVAVKENQEKALEYLLENKAETSPGSFSTTPLHLAAEYDHLECLQILLKFNALVDPKNENHDTPLHLACQQGYVEIAKSLLK